MPRLSLIAAVAANGVIGKDNQLPWHLPADLGYFKKTTSGHTIIMGRKNYEDIGRPLPNRTNIVVSRQKNFSAPGCLVFADLDRALAHCENEGEVFIIGGATLYQQTLDRADRLYLTFIDHEFEGDTYFPEINFDNWTKMGCESHQSDKQNPYSYQFCIFDRKQQPV